MDQCNSFRKHLLTATTYKINMFSIDSIFCNAFYILKNGSE